ncbi:DedA family protein [Actinacidiphila glaucinigra]|uniref:DedA family protein n=1 Tax=Actinacidiphila glaucinigra TaxID=235986 RepID=UPI003D92F664
MDVLGMVSALDFTAGLEGYLRDGHVFWAYAVLAATTAPPLVPNAALLVTGGVLAAQGRLSLALVLLVVAGSALVGDLLIHRTGRAVSGKVLTRLYRRPRRRALLEWASVRIQRHGVPFVIAVRFLPSGRMVGGLSAGIVRYPARRYMIGAGVAEAVWATYSVGLGYFGGLAVSNSLYAVALGLGVSLAVAGVGSVAQMISGHRSARAGAPPSARVVASGGAVPGGAGTAEADAPDGESADRALRG